MTPPPLIATSTLAFMEKKKKRKYIKATKLTLKGLQINMAFECIWQHIKDIKYTFFFFLKESFKFQPMASTPDDSSLSSDQDTNQFLV